MHGLMCVPSVYFNPQERHINQDTISDSVALAELKETLLISTLLRRGSMASTCCHLSKRSITVGSQLDWDCCIGKQTNKRQRTTAQNGSNSLPSCGSPYGAVDHLLDSSYYLVDQH